MASVEQRIRDLVVQQLNVSAEQVTRDASFINDLGADSMDLVELIMNFEEAFEVDISDVEAEQMGSLSDLLKYLETQGNS
jgi:acyl carrier protein